MPLRFNCVSHAFFNVSTSVVSAWATLSMLGQSASSITSHSVLLSSRAMGSKPWAIGFTISPGLVLMSNFLPSKCVTSKVKPQSASTRDIFLSMKRSAPLRLKTGCSSGFSTKMTSPVSASGCSSAISRNTTLWPSGEPFCTCTSMISRSDFVLKLLPAPPHELHCDCICWIIGPMRTTSTLTPRPSQDWQCCTPFFLSMTCLVMAIFFVHPLYNCSNVTFKGCTTSLVFCRRFWPLLRAPPKKASKISVGSLAPPPSKPSSPKRS
mmetsp:Transcript_2448/g.7004  ORF Transcript_2448/g.7004 Transcript_2448/m.7004 type:complete len:266 (-) Transcript_2448:342-1139(-)